MNSTLPIIPLQVTLSLLTWALKYPSSIKESSAGGPFSTPAKDSNDPKEFQSLKITRDYFEVNVVKTFEFCLNTFNYFVVMMYDRSRTADGVDDARLDVFAYYFTYIYIYILLLCTTYNYIIFCNEKF